MNIYFKNDLNTSGRKIIFTYSCRNVSIRIVGWYTYALFIILIVVKLAWPCIISSFNIKNYCHLSFVGERWLPREKLLILIQFDVSWKLKWRGYCQSIVTFSPDCFLSLLTENSHLRKILWKFTGSSNLERNHKSWRASQPDTSLLASGGKKKR